ncbi:MAG TPA: tetratricopeptide repeat protein [Chitinophagaceae bacterium]|nr:tetratricopeptide repeat protein [Chitinophagaceae bacterium]
MNRRKISVLSFCVIILVACGNNEEKNILATKTYASITDSLEKYPDNADLLFRRGELLSQNNQHELANADFQKAWKLKPTEETAMSYVSNLFLIDKPAAAIDLLHEASKKFPDNQEFKRRLSEAYLQSGDAGQALELYNSILQTDSMNFEAWHDKGLLLAEMDDTNAAIAALQRSYAIQPLSMNGIPLANLYAETKNPLALAICDSIIAKDSVAAAVDPYYIKGVYYSNTAQHKLAIEEFEECIKRDWKFSDAYIEKGIVLFEMKNVDEALQTFKLATTVTPRNADAYYWQARCYESIGKRQEAEDNYVRALTLDRTFREAREHLNKLQQQK